MYSVQGIIDLPPDDLEKVLKAGRKRFLQDLLEKLSLRGLIDERFGQWDIIDSVLYLSDEELYEELPEFILETNPTRGEAIVFLYNAKAWRCSLWDTYIVNDFTFVFAKHLDKGHPIGYFLGDHLKVNLSERYFKMFKRMLEKVQIIERK